MELTCFIIGVWIVGIFLLIPVLYPHEFAEMLTKKQNRGTHHA